MSLQGVSRFLQAKAGFLDTAEVYRLPKAGRIGKFLKLFGFEMKGSGPGMTIRRPVGAASAASSAVRGRPQGSVDIAPRIPRAVMAASTALVWTPDNPDTGTPATVPYTHLTLPTVSSASL